MASPYAACVAGASADDDPANRTAAVAGSARPSSRRRVARLRALIEALSVRELDAAGVASLLDCSPGGARKYLHELLEASVIRCRQPGHAEGRAAKGFRLNGDAWIVRSYLMHLSEAQFGNALLKRGKKRAQQLRTVGTRHFHIMADDGCNGVKATQVVVRRDPLVAALFGERNLPATAAAFKTAFR